MARTQTSLLEWVVAFEAYGETGDVEETAEALVSKLQVARKSALRIARQINDDNRAPGPGLEAPSSKGEQEVTAAQAMLDAEDLNWRAAKAARAEVAPVLSEARDMARKESQILKDELFAEIEAVSVESAAIADEALKEALEEIEAIPTPPHRAWAWTALGIATTALALGLWRSGPVRAATVSTPVSATYLGSFVEDGKQVHATIIFDGRKRHRRLTEIKQGENPASARVRHEADVSSFSFKLTNQRTHASDSTKRNPSDVH